MGGYVKKLMKGVYEHDFISTEYNCNMTGKLSLTAILKELELVAVKQLESMDISNHRMKQENMAFVLSKLRMKIVRIPKMNENLKASTTPQFTKGVCFLRKSQLGTLEGELLVDCQTAWVLIDPQNKKILRPSAFTYDLSLNKDEPYEMDVLKDRISVPDDMEFAFSKVVRFNDLDSNQHMNNTLYATIITDALPIEITSKHPVSEIRLHYCNECKYGDVIEIKVAKISDNRFVVCGCVENKIHFSSDVIFDYVSLVQG